MDTDDQPTSREPPGPLAGRLALLFTAYAPVAIILGARTWPHAYGKAAVAVGLIGALLWLTQLRLLPGRQARTVCVTEAESVDTEVTGYLVSLLLPLVAAGNPTDGDLVAYGICGALILFVAFATDLAAVNPFIYVFGYRVARANVAIRRGREPEFRVILLNRAGLPSDGVYNVSQVAGVMLVGELNETEEQRHDCG